MRFHHNVSDATLIAVILVCYFVFVFNTYKMGRLNEPKYKTAVIIFGICAILLTAAAILI
ncbi:MAG: hypothetical protein IKU13_03915 [Clostridia bacterium]|nr:hypothetical protein [Clostridia bacterium]